MVVFRRRTSRRVMPANRAQLARTPLVHVCLVALALGTAGCASSGARETRTQSASPNFITADEIAKANVQNAFDIVQKLRPAMFRPRQLASMSAPAKGDVVVYVDNTRYGDASSLRQIAASSVAAVRYFSASEAQQKWGSGHPGGVIEVLTKR